MHILFSVERGSMRATINAVHAHGYLDSSGERSALGSRLKTLPAELHPVAEVPSEVRFKKYGPDDRRAGHVTVVWEDDIHWSQMDRNVDSLAEAIREAVFNGVEAPCRLAVRLRFFNLDGGCSSYEF